MKRYLVTGGTGFIGAGIVKRLITLGHRVTVLDNNTRGADRRLAEFSQDFEMILGDIRNAEVVRAAVKNQDSVLHLAYINGTEFFYEKPDEILDVGVTGMLNVIKSCISENIPEMLTMSSSEVYQTPPRIPTDEDVPLVVPDLMNPRYCYGGGKIISELLTVNYGRKYFDRVLVIRPHNVFGPDMGGEHVIPQFTLKLNELCKRLGKDKEIPFPIQGSGEETRAFVYIDDFVQGTELVLTKGEHLNVYHIGTQAEVSIAELAHKVASSMGVRIHLEKSDLLPGSTLRRCPDISKIKQLGYEPICELNHSISTTVAWYVKNSSMFER